MKIENPFFASLPPELPLAHKIYAADKCIDEQLKIINSLTAKAELFDELVAKLEAIESDLGLNGKTFLESAVDNAVAARDFLSKAKELK